MILSGEYSEVTEQQQKHCKGSCHDTYVCVLNKCVVNIIMNQKNRNWWY